MVKSQGGFVSLAPMQANPNRIVRVLSRLHKLPEQVGSWGMNNE